MSDERTKDEAVNMVASGGAPKSSEEQKREAFEGPAALVFPADGAGGGASLETVRVSDVQAQPLRWLWPDRFAIGKINIVSGGPGLGKSLLTLMMAAHVTRGTQWPVDGTHCPHGRALMLCGEDDVADTIRPRLEAMGADLERIEVVQMVADAKGRRGFDLQRDTERLVQKAESMGDCRLIIIDPVSAHLGRVDSHSNAEVRGLLAGLAEASARIGVATVMVSHLNKGTSGANAVYRTSGSLAFVAAARSAYIVAKDPANPERRLFLPQKNNLAKGGSGLAYRVASDSDGQPRLEFEAAPVTITADEALAVQPNASRPCDEVKDWLQERLADGPVLAADIFAKAAELGFAEITVRRAKK